MIHASTGKGELETLERQARIFQAMASPLRIAILRLLQPGDLSVNEIVGALFPYSPLGSVERSNVSKHLAVLRKEAILSVAGDSRRRVYHLAQPCLLEAIDCVLEGGCAPVPAPKEGAPAGSPSTCHSC